MTLSTTDQLLVLLYFAAVLVIGFHGTKKKSDATDFLLAGRALTLPLFVMTLVSTWYGGILGVGEFSYLYGISNWVVQGVPYYIFAALFALLLAKKIRATNFLTIADKLHQEYDLKTALLGSFLTFLLMTPAPYVLMLAFLLQLVTGWHLTLCLIVGTATTTIYLFFGGFKSDVKTDVFEFVLMFVGFGVIIPFVVAKFGGLDFLRNNLPPQHLTWHGGNSMQYILVWFFIALWTLIDPSFHQRCYAAKSGETAQKGILVSIIFWFMFDAMTATAGLYARAVLPSLDQPVMAFPMLAEATLPPVAKGLFFIGMLATIMSTLNTLAFISATTIGRDIVWRLRRETDESNVPRYTRWGLLFTAVVAICVALLIPSVIKQWYTIGTVIVPGLLVPVVTSYFERWKVSARYAFAAMLLGWLTSSAWLMLGWREGAYPFGIEPMYPGLVVAIVMWGLGKIGLGERRDKMAPYKTAGGQEPV